MKNFNHMLTHCKIFYFIIWILLQQPLKDMSTFRTSIQCVIILQQSFYLTYNSTIIIMLNLYNTNQHHLFSYHLSIIHFILFHIENYMIYDNVINQIMMYLYCLLLIYTMNTIFFFYV